jgi:ketosteroid isomerase-like protein
MKEGCIALAAINDYQGKALSINIKIVMMENQILELEKKYWDAMESHDFNTVKSLTRFPCLIAGQNGVQSVDEASFKKMFDSGKGKQMKVLNISNEEIQVMNDNAIIAYLIELENNADGEQSSKKCACASAWVKENNNWVCSLHTESQLN